MQIYLKYRLKCSIYNFIDKVPLRKMLQVNTKGAQNIEVRQLTNSQKQAE